MRARSIRLRSGQDLQRVKCKIKTRTLKTEGCGTRNAK
jgi:hypothetical protein